MAVYLGSEKVSSGGGIGGGSTGGLPSGGTPYQQLVTDGDGNAEWQDRLCYIDSKFTELLPEQSVAFSNSGGGYSAQITTTVFSGLTTGLPVTVVWDGEQYDLTVKEQHGGMYIGNGSIMGLEDTGEPFFAMIFPEQGIQIATTLEGDSHTISISAQVTKKKLLDKDYLSEDSVVISEQIVSTGMPEYINLNGITTSDVKIRFNAKDYYKVSDLMPSVEALVDSQYQHSVGGWQDIYAAEILGQTTDDYSIFRNIFVFYKADSISVSIQGTTQTVNVPETGIYVNGVSYIKFNQTVTHRGIIIPSSIYKSNKKFFLTVDDSGTISATEV